MGCHLHAVMIPAVISALLLWEGVQCRTREYSLEVPSQVTVQDGLCVLIPCNFTYPVSRDDRHAHLYGYWYVENQQSRRPRLVATNNPKRIPEINPQVRRRFEVSGPKLNSGDCSLTINDAQAADQATYHFRMEKGHKRCSYSAAKERLSVIVTERKLDITIFEPLRAGQRESIFCKTQRCSSLEVPEITWEHASQISPLETSPTVNHNSVEERMDFIPTAADRLQNVTCKITYGEGSSRRSVEKTVTLNIHYPPRVLPFSGYLQIPRGDVQNFPDVSDSQIVTWTDDSLLVRCEADANPPSNQTWVRIPSHSSRLHISNNELKISRLRLEDTGKYECQARNQEGTSRASFYLHVQDFDDYAPMAGP
ncbi:PREDICTED: sialic acid-binding Ig-like lectin 12 [Gekko japonicus]|uniref:Sialic acid-binding Ig-like lectin 12 n=1 Tax=Gekko japonicus TaxID=146911 RepID=A0ABM1KW87_GEKJA|nr:PREDICTED: sialic acid-binding Ig-like lectin 12 [Gekko japonicus]XP_015277974.1 PREDICTED: sialic acid-binding Ig-like lectin 12 [Gekko japonicus]